jgi:hypothetical protein
MASTTVGASVQVEFSSIGQMRRAIKEATSDLIAMQEQFGKTSPQAIAAAKRIAELKDRIQDAKEQADLFDPGKRFSAFANAANQIAAGFSAVQGAMALVGTESEDLQKTLVKVQGAIALSQGLSQLRDLGKAYDEIKIVAVDAFKSIRAAIGSTGIGLLVVALAGIVAYWDDIKEAVSGVSAEQKKLNEESAKNVKAQQDKLDALGLQENSLKLQGKSEREILELKIKQTDELIKASEIQIQNTIATTKAQVEAAQRNKDILQGILTFISSPIAALLKGIDLIGEAVGKNFDLYNKFYGGISSFVFDPKEVKEEGDAAIKEQEKALKQLQSQRDGFVLQRKEIDKQDAAKIAAAAKKLNDEKIAFEKEFTKFLQDENARRLKIGQDSFDQERTAIDNKYKELIAKAKHYGLDTSEIERLRFQETKDLVNKTTVENQVGLDKQLSNFGAMVPKMATMQTTLTANQATESAIRKRIDEQELESKRQMADQTAGILNGLSELFGKQTQAGKAAAIAAIVIEQAASISRVISNTAAANAKAIAASPLTGGMPWVALNTVSAAVSIASSIANARKSIQEIKSNSQSVSGGGAPAPMGGGGAPVAAQPSPTVTAQTLNAQAINNLGNQGMRAYVLNSDITNNEQRNAYLQRNARLG